MKLSIMNTERIRKLIANPAVSRSELEQQIQQALKVNDRDLALDIQEIIDDRFGITPVVRDDEGAAYATFRTIKKSFDHAKDGYLWLVERFVEIQPEIFTEPTLETTGFIALGRARNSEGKPVRNYFAKSPAKLFRATPTLAENSNNHAELRNGWYANINLRDDEKLEILIRFGGVLRLVHGKDWSFVVQTPSAAFQALLNMPSADDLLAEIDGWKND